MSMHVCANQIGASAQTVNSGIAAPRTASWCCALLCTSETAPHFGRKPHLSPSSGGEVEGCGRGRVSAANVRSGWVHPRRQGGRSPSARGKPLLHRCTGKFHRPSHRHNC
ncbi:unnamed protein product, partial [Ectocarpus sp. 12 AP-2014]